MTMALDVVAFLERAMDDARTTNFAGLYYLVTGSVIAGAPRNEGDITSFEARHPIGSRARLALALLLYTGQRRSDVVRMGRQHVRDGAIDVRQQKTGTELSIPMHPELQAVIEASEVEHLTFLITKNGKPFSPAGFTNWFRECCNEAGLPKGLSAHGLRKATCRRLAEAGCSGPVIMAISGHKSLREVETYIRDAEQKRMAKLGVAAMTRTSSRP